mgnify:CR=1 FL=1
MDVLSADTRVRRTPVSLLHSRHRAGEVRWNGDKSSLVIEGGVEPPHSMRNVEQVQRSDPQIYRGDTAIGDE